MSATVLERDMLKTDVPERAMAVTTYLRPGSSMSTERTTRCPPWSAVWQGATCRAVWLHFWQGPTTPGGLAEAHAHVVEQVQRGAIPAPAQEEDEPLPTRGLSRLGARHAAPGESD